MGFSGILDKTSNKSTTVTLLARVIVAPTAYKDVRLVQESSDYRSLRWYNLNLAIEELGHYLPLETNLVNSAKSWRKTGKGHLCIRAPVEVSEFLRQFLFQLQYHKTGQG